MNRKFLRLTILSALLFQTANIQSVFAQSPADLSPIEQQNANMASNDLSASVLLYGNFSENTHAKGLIFNENTVKEVLPDQVKILDPQHLLIEFTIKAADITSRTSYSGVATNTDGRLVAGTSMTLIPEISTKSFVDTPICEPSEADLSMQSQLSTLENLIKARSDSRNNRQAQLRANLTTDLIERIKKTEQSFGFNYNKEIGLDSPPYEIVSRLNRVYNSLRNYRIAKGK